MESRQGKKWSREETLLAFDLYCAVPFSKIDSHNPQIIGLANVLGRSAGSVALKMANLAHFDPEQQHRGISGMAHASKLDSGIYAEFLQNSSGIINEIAEIKEKYYPQSIVAEDDSLDYYDVPEGLDRKQLLKIRIGQNFFRKTVLNAYGNKCCITGLNLKEMLVASHIKPWRDSDEKNERTTPRNGLCLNPFHDKAFDQGFITIDTNYRVILSTQMKKVLMDENTKAWFYKYEGEQIILPRQFKPAKEFIQYHNDVIFKG
jgi:putative restriction endonuclease